jgi:signal transduction histidine kinase/HAMP domain-containing protein
MINLVLFTSAPYINLPFDLLGWIGWFMMAALLLWFMQKEKINLQKPHFWLIATLLLTFGIITALFFGVNLPWGKTIPLPNVPQESNAPEILVFVAIPMMLAAGILGSWPAVLIGLVSGIISAFWNTHSVFTPLEYAIIAYLISLVLRQNYRTLFYRVIRKPLGAAILIALFSTPLYLVSTFFSTNGSVAARLDYCFTQSWMLVVTTGIQLILAGLLCELFLVQKLSLWVQFKTLEPSPSESGLQARVLSTTLPMALILMITLSVADWAVAGQAARSMVKNQLQNAADSASQNIPYIIETGQSLVSDIIASGIPLEDQEKARLYLQEKIRSAPFFEQFYLFDLTGAPLTGYPISSSNQLSMSAEEQAAITLALNGVQIQSYTVPPANGTGSVQISFLAAIPDEYGLSKGVLLARTNLDENLFSQPTIQAFSSLKTQGGEGILLDADNTILFDTNASQVMTTYSGSVPTAVSFYDESSGTGTRRIVYAEPIPEKKWMILVSLPASTSQDLALQIAIPLLILSLVFAVAAYFLLRYLMQTVTFSLVKLANQATSIAQGSLDTSIQPKGVDEVGRLSSAFEQMRLSLKSRLQELDRLLEVSQGVAANLSIEGSSEHILKAALSYGASSARIVIFTHPENGLESPTEVYAAGPRTDDYAVMDKILLDFLRTEKVLVIPSRTRLKRMGIAKGGNVPNEMLGAALRDGETYLGILWVGYADPHRFLDGEIQFFNTLANQVLVAVSNSSLYLKAELGKHRLESVLASTPDPVFLVDHEGNLLMNNQAACDIEGVVIPTGESLFGTKKVGSSILKSLLAVSQKNEGITQEITLENGRTYLISLTPVEVEDKKAGKVCVLHDVTEYKALEKMKSDFVTTVSHDLQSPLIQLKGYASMLSFVGTLNDQQKEFNDKTIESAENMIHMVDNLLNLGRIESGLELKIEKISPLELLDKVVDQLKPQIVQRKVQVMKKLTTAQELVVEADNDLLQQALINLLDNAIKYSHLGGQINLGVQENEKSVIFEIQDYGPGIAPLDVPNIFAGVQKNTRKDGQGSKNSGLGLAIVKQIALRHHGKVSLESELGKGSTFYLEIPIHQEIKEKQK